MSNDSFDAEIIIIIGFCNMVKDFSMRRIIFPFGNMSIIYVYAFVFRYYLTFKPIKEKLYLYLSLKMEALLWSIRKH